MTQTRKSSHVAKRRVERTSSSAWIVDAPFLSALPITLKHRTTNAEPSSSGLLLSDHAHFLQQIGVDAFGPTRAEGGAGPLFSRSVPVWVAHVDFGDLVTPCVVEKDVAHSIRSSKGHTSSVPKHEGLAPKQQMGVLGPRNM